MCYDQRLGVGKDRSFVKLKMRFPSNFFYKGEHFDIRAVYVSEVRLQQFVQF
jgi:hypothetical protein